ncbi:MAG: hypothetical protein IH916_05675, partial [Acidobacteria bacterium]|nr:hypothetical protein [Acidobacteriota bacterium]
QVKTAHRIARAAGMIGGELDGLLAAAYGAAKRVRSTTKIGERPVSIAAAALDVTRDIHGDLGPRTGLLIGLGEMGEMVARRLLDGGLGRLAVTHRTASRAAARARSIPTQRGKDCLPADSSLPTRLPVWFAVVLTSNKSSAIWNALPKLCPKRESLVRVFASARPARAPRQTWSPVARKA